MPPHPSPSALCRFIRAPDLGGHCIPVDPFYLSWKAREYDFSTRFIELAGEINTSMPYHVVDSIADALNQHKKSLKGSKVLILGVAYKKDVDDLRESPTLKIMEILQKRGADFDYNDPYFPQLHKMRHYDYSHMKSVPLNPATLSQYDAVLIATDHSSLRLRRDRGRLEARRRYAQRHAPRDAPPRKNRSLLNLVLKLPESGSHLRVHAMCIAVKRLVHFR